MVTREAGANKVRYDRWIWESLKLIGGASIAAILALQLKLGTVSEQMMQTRKDITEIKDALAKISEHDDATRQMIIDNREHSARERSSIDRQVEGVKDAVREHRQEMLQRELDRAQGKKPK